MAFHEGDPVRVDGGRFAGFIGRFIAAEGHDQARISLVLFGAATDVGVALADLAATTEEPLRPRVTRALPDGPAGGDEGV